MSDLRAGAIEAMAANDHPRLLVVAEHHLDRLLVYLRGHRQEWDYYDDYGFKRPGIFAVDLLAVLEEPHE